MTKTNKEIVRQRHITEVLSGKKTVVEICADLGIKKSRYYAIIKGDPITEKVENLEKKIELANTIIDESKELYNALQIVKQHIDAYKDGTTDDKMLSIWINQFIDILKTSNVLKRYGLTMIDTSTPIDVQTYPHIPSLNYLGPPLLTLTQHDEELLGKFLECTFDYVDPGARDKWKADLKKAFE